MANTYYQSVRIKPQTMLSEVYLTGDVSLTGVSQASSIQEIYNTEDPYLIKYLTNTEKLNTNLEDSRKTELAYLLTNTLKLWFLSKLGDYGRDRPGMGGPLDEYIGKGVSAERAELIKVSLTSKIEIVFGNILTINSLTVTPVPEQSKYSIKLVITYIIVNKAFSLNQELAV